MLHIVGQSARTMQPLSPLLRAAQRGDVEELRRLARRVRQSVYLCTDWTPALILRVSQNCWVILYGHYQVSAERQSFVQHSRRRQKKSAPDKRLCGTGCGLEVKGWRRTYSPASRSHAEPPVSSGCHTGAWRAKATACKRHSGLHSSPSCSCAKPGIAACANECHLLKSNSASCAV